VNEQGHGVRPERGGGREVPRNAKSKATLIVGRSVGRGETFTPRQVSWSDDDPCFWSPALIHNGALDFGAAGTAEFTRLPAR
jgi:hypothetical protein